jgi:hypothetical protein
MIRVVITRAELEKVAPPWPGATPEQRLAFLMRNKGLRFRFSLDPMPTDLMQPWYASQCALTGDITIEQGGSADTYLAARYQQRAHALHRVSRDHMAKGHWLAALIAQEDCAMASLSARQIMGIE